jgi:hypothetical protein
LLCDYDVWVSKRLDDDSWTNWSEPRNLGRAVNGKIDDSVNIKRTGEIGINYHIAKSLLLDKLGKVIRD